ncbi:hypothetical protein VNO78_06043 [Psophocarpus tetragonolobus]|uniref:Uncharacterized protein n=1 Tax=Psophocarpus tetragonolobus TaxID=3891 RepID=A0AAN9T0S9_PSOTE
MEVARSGANSPRSRGRGRRRGRPRKHHACVISKEVSIPSSLMVAPNAEGARSLSLSDVERARSRKQVTSDGEGGSKTISRHLQRKSYTGKRLCQSSQVIDKNNQQHGQEGFSYQDSPDALPNFHYEFDLPLDKGFEVSVIILYHYSNFGNDVTNEANADFVDRSMTQQIGDVSMDDSQRNEEDFETNDEEEVNEEAELNNDFGLNNEGEGNEEEEAHKEPGIQGIKVDANDELVKDPNSDHIHPYVDVCLDPMRDETRIPLSFVKKYIPTSWEGTILLHDKQLNRMYVKLSFDGNGAILCNGLRILAGFYNLNRMHTLRIFVKSPFSWGMRVLNYVGNEIDYPRFDV